MDTCATGSHRRCRPEKWEGQQMAMGPAAKSLVAISTNVAGTVLIITLEVAYRIWLKRQLVYTMMSRCVNLGWVCFNPTSCNWSRSPEAYKICQKARPAGHSDLHWPYSVRCVKCRQTVHSFGQEIQAPLCGESFRISSNITVIPTMSCIGCAGWWFLKPMMFWGIHDVPRVYRRVARLKLGPWSRVITYTLSKEKGPFGHDLRHQSSALLHAKQFSGHIGHVPPTSCEPTLGFSP